MKIESLDHQAGRDALADQAEEIHFQYQPAMSPDGSVWQHHCGRVRGYDGRNEAPRWCSGCSGLNKKAGPETWHRLYVRIEERTI